MHGSSVSSVTHFSFSLSVLAAIFQVDLGWVSQYQNVSILDFITTKVDGSGDDNRSYKTCKAPVESSQTNQYPTFYRLDALLSPNQQCQSTEGMFSNFGLLFHTLLFPTGSYKMVK